MTDRDVSAATEPPLCEKCGERHYHRTLSLSAATERKRPFFWRHPHFNWKYVSCQNVEVCGWCGRTIDQEEEARRASVR